MQRSNQHGGYGGGGRGGNRGGGRSRQQDGERGLHTAQRTMDLISAPYNFVPLSEHVYFPNWADKVSHDVPFSDALSGTLNCTLETESPIYVRNGGIFSKEDREQELAEYLAFFNVEGKITIPGTSIKGSLRNLVEVISFAKFSRINPHRYSIRDLQGDNKELYINHFTRKRENGKIGPEAGWLEQDTNSGEWRLIPSRFCRVDQNDLIEFHGDELDIKSRQNGPEKYARWGDRPLEVSFDFCDGELEKAINLGKGAARGTVVLTGQGSPNTCEAPLHALPSEFDSIPRELKQKVKFSPRDSKLICQGVLLTAELGILKRVSDDPAYLEALDCLYQDSVNENKRGAKHLEFIFYDEASQCEPLVVSKSLQEDFEFIHSSDGEPNAEWSYWKPRLQDGDRVPVFYLDDQSGVTSIGLAMMYRLPYTFSIRETIGHTSVRAGEAMVCHHYSDSPDLAQTMFGYIDQHCAVDQKRLSLKGRISISHAEAFNNPHALSVERPILGTPKPTYFANYLEQPNNLSKPEVYYKTYMQDKSNDQCRVRGWKRYPARKAKLAKAPSAGQEFKRVRTPLVPLSPGARFTFTARFHNLRIVELGALVWALTWGGDEKLRHSIGMAKPFGYGQALIALNCDKSKLKDIKGNPLSKDTEKVLSDAMTEFEHVMEEFAKNCGLNERGWKGSSQIVQLRAMADPTCDKLVARTENGTVITCCQDDKLRQMELKNVQGKNEFVEARKWDQRVHNKFRLERHVDENDPEVRHRYGK